MPIGHAVIPYHPALGLVKVNKPLRIHVVAPFLAILRYRLHRRGRKALFFGHFSVFLFVLFLFLFIYVCALYFAFYYFFYFALYYWIYFALYYVFESEIYHFILVRLPLRPFW